MDEINICISYGDKSVTPMLVITDNGLKVVYDLLQNSGTTSENIKLFGTINL